MMVSLLDHSENKKKMALNIQRRNRWSGFVKEIIASCLVCKGKEAAQRDDVCVAASRVYLWTVAP